MTKTLLEKYEAELRDIEAERKEYRRLGYEELEIRADGKIEGMNKMIYILKKHEGELK